MAAPVMASTYLLSEYYPNTGGNCETAAKVNQVINVIAGLLSAAVSSTLSGMQANPVDLTNVLLLQLLQADQATVNNGQTAVTLSTLSPNYSSSHVWAHMLLQIALLLFSLSLCLNSWGTNIPAFGIMVVFYLGTFILSVWRLESPLKIPGTGLVQAICKTRLSSGLAPNEFTKLSAVKWIIEKSTDPKVVEAAVTMIPLVQWLLMKDASVAFARLRDNIKACRDTEELYLKYGNTMAYLCSQPMKICPNLVQKEDGAWNLWGGRRRFIRDAFKNSRDAYRQSTLVPAAGDSQRKYKAGVRTGLRTMVVHGLDCRLSLPDEKELIWKDYDWLVDYLHHSATTRPTDTTDNETLGDALLALSAMPKLGNPDKQSSYIRSLIRCMASPRHHRVRHARNELAFITNDSMPQGVNAELMDELSRALLTAVRPNDDQTTHGTGADDSCRSYSYNGYLHLICALTRKDEWCQRLTRDDHLAHCISLVDRVCRKHYSEARFYLLVILWGMKSSGKYFPVSPAERRRLLITNAWEYKGNLLKDDDDYLDEIPTFVTATGHMTASDDGVPREWFADLAAKVHRVLVKLQERQAILVNDGVARAKINAAIPHVRGLHDDLVRMVEQWNASQRNDGASRS
ncbi:hypothetical protein EV702DRAFT_1199479 [Suillus placidus]|uniref:Uncharacterized protein n=1 Tax=Suillus placidus TaxID=48579 RepID=A0A9P6ZRH9_9AGAM|nr:hypothetical protein EV702DRAFT_1199479 [Suillus placidus]